MEGKVLGWVWYGGEDMAGKRLIRCRAIVVCSVIHSDLHTLRYILNGLDSHDPHIPNSADLEFGMSLAAVVDESSPVALATGINQDSIVVIRGLAASILKRMLVRGIRIGDVAGIQFHEIIAVFVGIGVLDLASIPAEDHAFFERSFGQ